MPYATLSAATSYAQRGRRAAHTTACPLGDFPCAACVPFSSAVAALDILVAGDAAPSTCRPARHALHDYLCRSGCVGAGRDEHARRQDKAVAALRRYVRETTP